jgi:hypothetical protein
VKHVPPSRANVMVPWSCLVNRQATWRPKDSVLWKSMLFGEANSRVMDGHGQLPSRDGPNRDRHIPRLLAWKGMLQIVRNELMT